MGPGAGGKLRADSLYFTVLSLAASAVNYAFYPVLARLLPSAAFGDVQIGVSFVMWGAALLTSLNALALYTVARGTGTPEAEPSIQPIERLVVAGSVVLAVALVALANPLASALSLSDPRLFYVLGVIFVVNVPASTWIGSVQGSGQFVLSGWIGLAAAALKTVAGGLLAFAGLGATGALLGLLLGTLLVLPLTKGLQHRVKLSFRATFRVPGRADFRFYRDHRTLGVIVIALALLAVLSTLDMVAAKALLPQDVAGSYAKASTAAKIPYYALVPFATVLFERFVKGTINVGRAVAAYSGIAIALTLGEWCARDLVLRIVFGAASEDAAQPFGPLMCAFLALSLAMLAAFRLVAAGRIGALMAVSAASSVVAVTALVVAPRTPPGIAWAFAAALALGAALFSLVAYTRSHARSRS